MSFTYSRDVYEVNTTNQDVKLGCDGEQIKYPYMYLLVHITSNAYIIGLSDLYLFNYN